MLPARAGHCGFCDTSFFTEIPLDPPGEIEPRPSATEGNLALDASLDPAWRSELATRLAAYRARRRKLAPNEAQTNLPFEQTMLAGATLPAVAVAESLPAGVPRGEEFAFTIAIGRLAKPLRDPREQTRMEIDVSASPARECAGETAEKEEARQSSSFDSRLSPVASLAERRIAALLDAGCLLFAYGGFLALFGSLGGQFTLSKLSAVVYVATIGLFYLQYFALFTVLGGTTPGMMLRGLQIVSFSGEPPTPQQLLARSAGYVLSAASFLIGFLWACWDEDHLTWHDRISHTYLTAPESLPHPDAAHAARGH